MAPAAHVAGVVLVNGHDLSEVDWLGVGFAAAPRLAAAVAVTLPILLYQLWSFLAPAIEEGKQRTVAVFTAFATLLFAAGTWLTVALVLGTLPAFLTAIVVLGASEERGGGHSVAGYSTIDGGMLLDLGPMKGIDVDPEARLARVQPGVVWGELDRLVGVGMHRFGPGQRPLSARQVALANDAVIQEAGSY